MEALSVVIITKNEEKNIARCLDSVVNIADEIIIVDSFSTDKTKEVSEAYNVIFISREFEGHIQQKNFALQQASYDLVLSLDADEELQDELQLEIQAIKKNRSSNAYRMRRMNRYCGKWIKHGAWYPDKRVRLVDRNVASWKGLNPHDVLTPKKGEVVQELKGHILHYTIDSLEDHLQQINYFSTLAAESKFKAGKKYHWWKLAFNPIWRFLKEYIFKFGFLDGYHGYQIARLSAISGYLRYAKLRELDKNASSHVS
ncbi:MAG: glycosyltransferase family 2 protein [Bacteroidota bacterium]